MNLTRLTRRRFMALTGAAMAVELAAPAFARDIAPTVRISGRAYGTHWHIVLRSGAETFAIRLAVEETLARIDRLMSPWRQDSAVSHFNNSRSTHWHPLDAEIIHVVRAALQLHVASGGKYDPTVGPVVGRWGFGPIRGTSRPNGSGITMLDGALCKSDPEHTLDLCGIAKGYAVDQVASALIELGESNFLIDLGGELAARGRHPSGRPWHVAIEDPRIERTDATEIITLDDRAVATSGDKANSFTVGSRRFSHIIDPPAAAPVDRAAASVSVIAAEAMIADGWATALVAAGVDGPALARRMKIDALFLFRDELGLRRVSVGGFDANLA